MAVRFIIILFFSSIMLFGCQKSNPAPEVKNSSNTETEIYAGGITSTKAPDFILKDINGKDVRLSDHKGKFVIIDFWATWCGPCRRGIPDLIELQKQYSKDLTVIGISVDQANTIKEVVPFYKSYGINYPVVYGNYDVVMKYGGIEGIPTSFVIDREGNILNKYVGLIPKEEYEKYLTK